MRSLAVWAFLCACAPVAGAQITARVTAETDVGVYANYGFPDVQFMPANSSFQALQTITARRGSLGSYTQAWITVAALQLPNQPTRVTLQAAGIALYGGSDAGTTTSQPGLSPHTFRVTIGEGASGFGTLTVTLDGSVTGPGSGQASSQATGLFGSLSHTAGNAPAVRSFQVSLPVTVRVTLQGQAVNPGSGSTSFGALAQLEFNAGGGGGGGCPATNYGISCINLSHQILSNRIVANQLQVSLQLNDVLPNGFVILLFSGRRLQVRVPGTVCDLNVDPWAQLVFPIGPNVSTTLQFTGPPVVFDVQALVVRTAALGGGFKASQGIEFRCP